MPGAGEGGGLVGWFLLSNTVKGKRERIGSDLNKYFFLQRGMEGGVGPPIPTGVGWK